MNMLITFMQVVLLAAVAPLVSGFIRKIKNNIRMRKGQSMLQPYYNLGKLFLKEEVVSENTSWIFRAAPYIIVASCLCALFFVPVFGRGRLPLCGMSDLIAIVFILSLGRFFLALAGLDCASAFGGMGSSREMFISSLAEPAAMAAVFSLSLGSGSTNIQSIDWFSLRYLSTALAVVSLFMVAIAETSRIPVDNQETHLELTMIHEAMVLEYSGRSLGLIEMASHLKQIVFFSIVAGLILPWPLIRPYDLSALASGICIFAVKIAVISLVVALIEVLMAKMRLFRVTDFLGFAFILAVMALLTQSIGL